MIISPSCSSKLTALLCIRLLNQFIVYSAFQNIILRMKSIIWISLRCFCCYYTSLFTVSPMMIQNVRLLRSFEKLLHTHNPDNVAGLTYGIISYLMEFSAQTGQASLLNCQSTKVPSTQINVKINHLKVFIHLMIVKFSILAVSSEVKWTIVHLIVKTICLLN